MYSLLLDQAWSSAPINTAHYFHDWVTTRYSHATNCSSALPSGLYKAWELLRTSAYNNTHLTSNAVPKSIFELAPNITGLVNRTGHHPTTLNYNTSLVVEAWQSLLAAANEEVALWNHPAYQHDLVDVMRQVFANTFLSDYEQLIAAWNTTRPTNASKTLVVTLSDRLLENLDSLDTLLNTLPQFRLDTWLGSARARASDSVNSTSSSTNQTVNTTALANFYEYTALNQVTLWGPDGEINDYASKQWGGLVGPYYGARWKVFLGYLQTVTPATYNATTARQGVKAVEVEFQTTGLLKNRVKMSKEVGSVRDVVEGGVPFLQSTGAP
jgi:alpha-N-acetylglucosaminidase